MSKHQFFPNWISDRVPGSVKGGLACIILGVVFLCFASSAFGQATRTWQGSDGGDWNIAANWSGGFVPQPGDNVIIDSDQSAPITGHPAISLLSLTVSGNVILESNAAPGTNDLITVTGTFSVAAGKTLTLGIPGAGGTDFTLATTATGTLDGTIFLNSNVTSVPIITVDGNLAIAADGLIFGQAGSRFTLSAGATLQIANAGGISTTGNATGAVQVSGTRIYATGANYIYNGTVPQVTGNGLTDQTPANLTISNTTGVSLSGFKTISGALTLNAGAIFSIPNGRYLGSLNVIITTGGPTPTAITGDGDGYLNLTGNLTVTDVGGGSAGAVISSLVDIGTGPRTITVANGAADADLTISGVIRNTGRIIKDGAGTLVLSAVNTYSGVTTINAGILRAGVNNALAGNLSVEGGTYDIATFTDAIPTVTLVNGSIIGTTGVLTGTNFNAHSGTISAILAGAASTSGLSKTTAGIVTLSGANTYSGTTNVSAGILRIGSANALVNSPVTLSGGTLSTGESTGITSTAGNFRVTANSTIALGTGSHELRFSNAGSWPGGILTITGWTGTAGEPGTTGKIFFGPGLDADKLARVTFSGYAAGAVVLPNGELVPAHPYRAQIVSANVGSPFWCAGETRNVSVVIRNTGAAAWTDGTGGAPTINIGVKWNTNGTSWNSYHVKVPAGNLAPNAQDTFTIALTAAENIGGIYGNPLADGVNNITFDVIYEGVGPFSSNLNGLGPGNTPFTSPAITISSAPSALTYSNNEPIYCAGEEIDANIPYLGGGSGAISYSISPALPAGLTLDTTTGQITGTPTTLAGVEEKVYTVTATNSCGSTNTQLTFEVRPAAPAELNYTNNGPLTYCVDQAIDLNNASTIGGGPATSYSVSPALPAGLSLDPTTGQISGIPTTVTSVADYVVTASNACGGTSRTLSISVSPAAPASLSYSEADPVYCAGVPITANEATTIGGGAATSYSVSPALPAGLTLDPASGHITGTPTTVTGETRASFTVTAANSCGSVTFSLNIAIAPAAPTDLNYTSNGPLIYCASEEITANSATTSGGAVTSYSISPSLPAGLTLNETTGQITGTPTAVDGVDAADYTITASNSCGQTSRVLNITITPAAPAVLSYENEGPLTYCANVQIDPNIANTIGGGAPTTFSVSPALPAGLTLNASTGEITGMPSTLSGVPATNYVVTASNSCGIATKILNIEILPARPTNLTYTDNGLLVYCVGEAITPNNAIASGGGPVTSYSISPALPAGLTLNTFTGQISGTPTTVAGVPATDYTVTASNSCGNVSTSLNITIAAQPTVSAGPALPIICQGGTSLPMGGSVGGGATGGIWSGGQGFWTNESDPAGATYTPSATESGSIIMTLTTTGGSCGSIYATKIITVNPTPTLASPLAATRCSNETVTYTAVSSLPATTFAWSRAAVNGISTPEASGTGASITETLINTTTNPIDVTYIITLTANGCSSTQNVTVTVNSETVIVENPDPEDYAVCFGDGFADISVAATGTNLTYQWYSNTAADTVSGTPIAGEVSATYRPASTPVGVNYYYVKVRGACGTLVSELTGKYEVKPTDTYYIENLKASETQEICFGEEFTELSVLADGIEPISYQWFSSTSPAQNTNGTAIPGATLSTFTPPSPTGPITTAVTTYYYVMASSGCGTIRSVKTGAFTVRPTAQIDDMTASVCSDGTFNVTPVNGTNGVVPAGTSYTWEVTTVEPGITGGTGGSGNSITGSLTNSTSAPLTAIFTVTPTTGTCTGEDFTLTVTVNPTPVIPAQEQTICSGDTFTISPVDGASGAIVPSGTTYTWTRVDNPSVTGDVNQGAQQSTISGTLINTTNVPQTVVYTVTPRSGAAGTCAGIPFSVTVTVDPKPSVPNQSISVCSGSEFIVSPTNGVPNNSTIVPANTSYTWTVVDNPNVTGESDQVNPQVSISQTLINTTNINQTVVYTVTPISEDTGSCTGSPFTVTVTVNPNPVIPDQSVIACSELPFTMSPVNSEGTIVPANTRYIWTVSDNPNVTGETDQTTPQSTISQTLINNTSETQTVIYTVIPTSGAAGNCVGPTFTVTVTIPPTLTLSSTLTPPAVCSGAPFTYIPTSDYDVSFAWSRPIVSGISNLARTGTGVINETLVNTTDLPIDVNYEVSLTANGCSRTQTVTVTVNPTPRITPAAPNYAQEITICSGDTFSFTPVNGIHGLVPGGTTYTWEPWNSGPVEGETAVTIPQTSISQTLVNTGNSSPEVTYIVTPWNGTCAGPQFRVKVIVLPTPTVNHPGPIGVCNGEETPAINFTGNNIPGKTYTWTNDNPSIGLPASGTGNIPRFTVINTGATDKVANITVTPHANGCSGTPQTFTITASAIPTVTLGADYCAVPGYVQLQAGSNIDGTTYTWNTVPEQYGAIINVNVAGNYTVTARTLAGCEQTASISVAQELVVNGSFTDGNVGFTTGNIYVEGVDGNSELVPEGTYAVGESANDYHYYFWGKDHTNNTVGPRNMLMVNTSDPTITAWQQTVNVEANTQYYFSAWALSINPAPQYPRPRLQFEVAGELVGSVLDLPPGPGAAGSAEDISLWKDFYGIWSSGEYSGPITLRIVNLEPSLAGNDFALDDISFGTLSTFLILTSPVGTDDQVVCENSPIEDISYSAGSGLAGPTVLGLPAGLSYSWNGVTLRITGTPTESGIFNYTVSTTGECAVVTKTGKIVVQNAPNPGNIAGDQTICSGDDPAPFSSTTPGSSPGAGITYRWESSVSPFEVWGGIDNAFGSIYDAPAGLTETTKYRRITLAESNGLICESLPETSPTVTVTVQTPPTPGAIAGEQAICEAGDPVAFTSIEAGTGDGVISYLWQLKTDESDWTTISGETGATYDVPAGLNVKTQYRRITVSTLNGKDCLSEPTVPVQVTVQSVPEAGEIAGEQTVCTDGGPIMITSQTDGTGTGTILYRWEFKALSEATWIEIPEETGASLSLPAAPTVTTQYRRFAISEISGQQCESNEPTATVTVTVQSPPTAGEIAGAQDVCSGDIPDTITGVTAGTGDGAITYLWESAISPFTDWTVIADAIDENYNAANGVTVTTQYRRRTVSTLNGAACVSEPTASVQVTISPDNTVTTAPSQTQCIGNPITSIIHTTTGATGIMPESASVRYNLPNGVTASWAAGVVTISGTPRESGVFDYNIPLAGGCGAVSATGRITVEDPQYPISRIDVINPQVGDPTPATSRFTVYSAELTTGTYTVVYSTSGVNQGLDRTITVNVTTPGQFTFTSLPYTLAGTTELTILSIQKSTDLCPYVPPYQNTALYGIGCSEAFIRANGNDAFYVPANVYDVTIQVFGNGMGGNTVSKNIPVWPSGVIYVVFDGTDVFATEVPDTEPMSDRREKSIVSTTGPNGRIVFSFDCNPVDTSCGTIVDNGNQYTDSNGFTVIRFDAEGPCTWQAPDGLTEFEVLVVGGGGGGGFGSAAGGGGGGAVVYQQYMDITMGGEPGLQGATFNISVGARGGAALTPVQAGGTGGNSSFSGPSFSYLNGASFSPLSAAGGGGGGSTSATAAIRQGGNGASGGGGAASGSDESAGGVGSAGTNGGAGYGETTGAGGGGGGGAAGAGTAANSAAGTMNGGSGGSGRQYDISGEDVYYGAGGGGTSSGATINQAGAGGSPYSTNGIDYVAGGGGTNNGLGQPATTYGSGGGAGSTGGSPGFPGVIYIRYPNYSILPVEYLHFDAKYNPTFRSGDLTWTTAKEWENERFDIERSINTVKDWETIGQVKGAGYSDTPLDYAYQDFNLPLAGGTIFYRLKQHSYNGDSSYSDTKAIRVEAMRGTSYWRVYPNPTTGNPISLELINGGIYNDEVVTVRIIAATGQYDVVESVAGSSLNTLVSERLRNKAAGLYTLEINWGIYREYHKVILRR